MSQSQSPSSISTIAATSSCCAGAGAGTAAGAPNLSSSPTASPTLNSYGYGCCAAGGIDKLGSDLEGLIGNDDSYSDAEIVVGDGGSRVGVHRCILAARSPFFRRVFAAANSSSSNSSSNSSNKKKRIEIDLASVTTGTGIGGLKIGRETVMIVLGYLYGGKVRGVEDACSGVACMDSQCPHSGCWPVIEFYLELLLAGKVFQVWELKNLAQERLIKLVSRGQALAESVLQIVSAAAAIEALEEAAGPAAGPAAATDCTSSSFSSSPLVELCIPVLARSSNLSLVAITKAVVDPTVAAAVVGMRQLEDSSSSPPAAALPPPPATPTNQKLCSRVYKALDCDDIELMDLLLKEANMSVDSVFALHYAASYCDVKTFGELLELGVGDINLRDPQGYTVLHAATLRRIPEVVGLVLAKGASPLETTPDGFTALQLSRRMARSKTNTNTNTVDAGREDWLRDRICVEILEQAENVNPCPVFPVVGEKELFMRLLYLENRVAFARLLWPREAKVVLGLSQLDSTKEFTADDSNLMDLNKEPSRSDIVPCMNETLVQRVNALQRAIEVGHRFFPRCTAILNNYMDDGSFEHACIQNRRIPEDQLLAKRKRVSEDKELKNRFAEAFQRDVEEQQSKLTTTTTTTKA